MTPTFTHLETNRSTTNATSYATGTVSHGASTVLLIAVSSLHNAAVDAAVPSLSGGGFTYTDVDTAVITTSVSRRVTVFRALTGVSAGTVQVTISFAAQTQQNCEWSIVEVTDCLVTGTNASDAVVQTKTNTNVSIGTLSITFNSGYGATDNRAFGAFRHSSDVRQFVAGTNFIRLGQALGSSANQGLCTLYGRDSDTVVDCTTDTGLSLVWGGVAVEIAGADDSAPPDPDLILPRTRRRGLNARIN
jgi:hypothetical protein